MKTDARTIIYLLGLLGLCCGRTMKLANIIERFCNADFAFKFRVVSRLRKDCFPEPTSSPSPSSVISTLQSTPLTTTSGPNYVISRKTPSDLPDVLAKTAVSTSQTSTGGSSLSQTSTGGSPLSQTSTGRSSDAFTKTPMPNSETTTSQTSTGESLVSTDAVTKGLESISETTTDDNMIIPATSKTSPSSETATTNSQPTFKQTQPTTGVSPRISSMNGSKVILDANLTSQRSTKLTTMKTPTGAIITEQSLGGVSTNPASQERSSSDGSSSPVTAELHTYNQTTTLQNQAPLRKRRCVVTVSHQDIKIMKKHVFKGNGGLKQMKWVKDVDDKQYLASIRLDMYFKELKSNRNYLFIGKTTPGGNLEDYVFMANELTVAPWGKVKKLKRKMMSNFKDTC